MSTGPWHYRQAEWLLGRAHHWTYGDGGDPAVGAALAAEAQAHATLALAAATAMAAAVEDTEPGMSQSDYAEWHKTCGVSPDADKQTGTDAGGAL